MAKLTEAERAESLRLMVRLYEEAERMRVPQRFLDAAFANIEANRGDYRGEERNATWKTGNGRHPHSVIGETNALVYAMHLWETLPPWVEVELLDDRKSQYVDKLDIRAGEKTIQVKTTHEGKLGDVYYHPQWSEGKADDVVAVCLESRTLYTNTRDGWREAYSGQYRFIDRARFCEYGGRIEPIHPNVVKIIEDEVER